MIYVVCISQPYVELPLSTESGVNTNADNT